MNSSAIQGIDLHDIVPAPAAGFWPPAPGWWLLAVVLLVIIYFIAQRLIRYWHQRRLQTRLLHELDSLSTKQPEQVVINISKLLRRVALMKYTREEVASLSGDAWLHFLDKTGGDGNFKNGIGKKLATLPYTSQQQISNSDNQALIALARSWLEKNGRHANEY